jgi:hypothetical protein
VAQEKIQEMLRTQLNAASENWPQAVQMHYDAITAEDLKRET